MKRLLILLVLMATLASAEQIVINSQDWRDVYSGMIYARLAGQKAQFIVNEGHGLLLADVMQKEDTLVMESVEQPFIRSYAATLQGKGFTAENRFIEGSLNLELAAEVQPEGYIIIDDSYSYNAVSVAPYAVRKGYYVIFANSDNIDEVSFLVSRGGDVIIYGYVDRAVSDELEQYNPIIINKGDKFSNNLEILKMFYDEFSANQLLLTNGAILEPQFFTGSEPVLFIGQTNVPDQTIQFLNDIDVNYAVLIGYDAFDNAVTLKNRVGIKVIVKFAKGIDAQQYALDIFPLPQPEYNIGISSVVYNTFSQQLEVSYFNTEEFPAFLMGSHNVLENNQSIQVLGDEDAIYIGSTETLTVPYSIDLTGREGLILRTNLLYGEDRGALEYLKIIESNVETTSYEDSSEIEISSVVYDQPTQRFQVEVRNTGSVTVYAKPLLIDIIVDNRQQTLTSETQEIEQGRTALYKIKADLTPADIADNEEIRVGVRYGRREMSLVNYVEQVFEFKTRSVSGWIWVVGTVIVVAALLIFFITRNRGRHDIRAAPPPRNP